MNEQFKALISRLSKDRSDLKREALERRTTAKSLRAEAVAADSFFQSIGYAVKAENPNAFYIKANQTEKPEDNILKTNVIDEVFKGISKEIISTEELRQKGEELHKIIKDPMLAAYRYDAVLAMLVLADCGADELANGELIQNYVTTAKDVLQNVLAVQGREDRMKIFLSQCDSTLEKQKLALQRNDMEQYVKQEKYMDTIPDGYSFARDGIRDLLQPYLYSCIKNCKTLFDNNRMKEFLDDESKKWFQENKQKCEQAKIDGYYIRIEKKYLELMSERLKQITKTPTEATELYPNIVNYKDRVKSEYQNPKLYQEMLRELAANYSLEIEAEVQMLFTQADDKLKADIAVETALLKENKKIEAEQRRKKEEQEREQAIQLARIREEQRKKEEEEKQRAALERQRLEQERQKIALEKQKAAQKAERKDKAKEQGKKLFSTKFRVLSTIAVAAVVLLIKFGASIPSLVSGPDKDQVSEEVWWEYLEKTLGEEKVELSPTATSAEDFEYQILSRPHLNMLEGKTSCTYSYTGVVITKYNGTDAKVEIPAVIEGYNVCEIARDAFYSNIYLEEVIIPDTVHTIREAAFAECKLLKAVTCSDNLAVIEKGAFSNCSALTSFSAEGGTLAMKYIGEKAFLGCTSLQYVKMNVNCDADIDLIIEFKAFGDCTNLKEVSIQGSALNSVLPRDEVFVGCSSLVRVDFWDKIIGLGRRAFAGCSSLENASLSGLENHVLPAGTFSGCTSLKSFHVTSNISGFEAAVFDGCTNLESVTFEQSISTSPENGFGIGEKVFQGTAIAEIELPGFYEYIGDCAFRDCKNLTKVVWHGSGKNTLTQSIGGESFGGCVSLKEIYLPRTLNFAGKYWNFGIMPDVTIYAKEGSVGYKLAVDNDVHWEDWTE